MSATIIAAFVGKVGKTLGARSIAGSMAKALQLAAKARRRADTRVPGRNGRWSHRRHLRPPPWPPATLARLPDGAASARARRPYRTTTPTLAPARPNAETVAGARTSPRGCSLPPQASARRFGSVVSPSAGDSNRCDAASREACAETTRQLRSPQLPQQLRTLPTQPSCAAVRAPGLTRRKVIRTNGLAAVGAGS